MTFNRPALLQSTYPDLRITGREKVGGDRVRCRDSHQRPRTHQLYFSESGVLLVRRGDRIETPLGAAPEFYDVSGFERVDWVMMPKKIVRSRADNQVTFEVTQIPQKGGTRSFESRRIRRVDDDQWRVRQGSKLSSGSPLSAARSIRSREERGFADRQAQL